MTDSTSLPSGPTISSAAPPYVDCIQWIPRRFAAGISPVTIVDLVFHPRVLADIALRAAGAPEASTFGVLLGRVFEDPTCDRRWGRVDRAIMCDSPPPEDADAEALLASIEAMSPAPGDDGSTVMGWFRSHVFTGLYLSPEEARFHEERFPEPWGFAVILAGAAERRSGGVFQRTAPEGLSRSAYTPFYELSPAAAGRDTAPRHTVISWPNYQTESRVEYAPEAARNAKTAGAEEAPVEPRAVATIPELGPSASDAPARPAAARSRQKKPLDGLPLLQGTDTDWEKVQIQRSLTAVGRTLGPSTIGELGAPESADAAAVTAPAPADGEPVDVSSAPVAPAVRVPGPAHRGFEETESGLVGRARRRRAVPARRIAVATAGFALMAAAGWVGTRMMADPAEDEMTGASSAGVGLSPGELFGGEDADPRRRDDSPPGDDPQQPAGAGGAEAGVATALDADSADVPALGADSAASVGTELVAASEAGVENETNGADEYDDGGAPPIPAPRPPEIIQAPDPSSVILDDPTVSAYENALSIFRAEVGRYEVTRDEFDQGLATCNPLNLSYRGVIDSHDRLRRRHSEAGRRLSDAASRAHQVAERQFALTKTHYELTDCPIPIGN